MIDSNLLIAVLMGGPGSERQVSLASGKAVLNALQQAGLNAVGVDVQSTEFELPEGTGLAYNLIHGTFGEDGRLQAYLEEKGIPYTGAGRESSRLAFDKNLAKERFVAAGVPTPAAEIVDVSGGVKLPGIPVPFVVKPPREGSSVGVSIVKTQEQALPAMEAAAKFGNDILVEAFVEGQELTVGILDGKALPIVHIIPPEGVYDMASKYPWLSGAKGSQYICPADLDEVSTAKVQAAALAAHQALGVEIYSRVDVLLDAGGNAYVLEANTIPGMTETSLLPKSAAASGIDFTALCLKIAEESLKLRA